MNTLGPLLAILAICAAYLLGYAEGKRAAWTESGRRLRAIRDGLADPKRFD